MSEPDPTGGGAAGGRPFDASYANRALALFVTVSLLVVFVEAMLIPSLPEIGSQYGLNISQTSLLLSFPLVFGTAVIPAVGKLGDIYGKKRVLLYVLVAYLATIVGCSFAPDFAVLLAARTVQGIGLAVFPLAYGLVREEFPRAAIPRAEGVIGAMEGAGIAVGISLGAYVSNAVGWQTDFQAVLPLVALFTMVISMVVRESANRRLHARLDYVGASWLGLSLAAIVLGLSEVSEWGWSSPLTLSLVLGGLAAIVPLALYERGIADSILNSRLLRIRNVMVSNMMILVSGLSTYGGFLAVTYKLQLPSPAGYGFDVFTTGLYLLPLSITIFVVAFPVSALVSRYGAKPFLYLGGLIGASGFILIARATTPGQVAAYLTVASSGMGTLFISSSSLLTLSVRKSDMGLSTSLNTVFSNIGTSLGSPVLAAILTTFSVGYAAGGDAVSLPTPAAFQYSFYFTAAGMIALVLLAAFAQEVIGKRANSQVLQESNAEQGPPAIGGEGL